MTDEDEFKAIRQEIVPANNRDVLTTEIYQKVEGAIKSGLSIQGTCKYCGIARATWYVWKLKAQREKLPLYVSFFDMVRKAEGFAELRLITEIQKDQSWQSKHAILKSRFKEDWGEKGSIEIQNEIKDKLKHSPTIDISLLDEDEQKTFLMLTEKALRKSISEIDK